METEVKKYSTCRILENKYGMIVTYWPSTEPINQEMHLRK